MRYLPDLIPEKHRVMTSYFKGSVYEPVESNILIDIVLWVTGISCLISSFLFIRYPLGFLLFGITGFILLPPGHRLCEKLFRFRFKALPRMLFICCMLSLAIPLSVNYLRGIKTEIARKRSEKEKFSRETAIAEQIMSKKRDTMYLYISQADRLTDKHKIRDAEKKLEKAMLYTSCYSDTQTIRREQFEIESLKTDALVKNARYDIALSNLNNLLEDHPSDDHLLYQRAVCYSKKGQIREAVIDLKPLLKKGNEEAEKLHNKINPVRKKVIGYETLCCDGSVSYSTGRGTCSHHGGVCDWNHPVYEKSRKYE